MLDKEKGKIRELEKGGWELRGCTVGILEVSVELKCPPSLLPEITGAGGFLQGDKGDLMTPGFPEQNYPNGALYQVKLHRKRHKTLSNVCTSDLE